MPLAYPPAIVPDDFVDGRRLAIGARRGGGASASSGVLDCPYRKAPPPDPEERLCAVTELTVRAGSKTSKSFREAGHTPVASGDGSRVNFAPKIETLGIHWKVENPELATAARLEIFRRKQSIAIHTVELTAGQLAGGTVSYDGSTEAMHLFPSGFLNVEHGPFKVKLTLEGNVKREFEQAFTYFDVLLHSITLSWGTYAELPKDRSDIHADHLVTILGDVLTPKKGFEEEAFDKVVAGNPAPAADKKHQVVLPCNLFAKKTQGAMEVEEYVQPDDFQLYKDLWGNGARIPIHAKALVKKADGSGTDTVPEALEGCRLIWDWHDPNLRQWREGLEPTAKTEDFLRDIFSQNQLAEPKNVANCPAALGGKLGDASAPIFRHYDGRGPFPFATEPGERRTWATYSRFLGAGTPAERCTTGIIFHPSRIAGDRYPVRCALYFDSSQDAIADVDVAAPAKAEAGTFEVFKKTTLQYLIRGSSDELGCDPDAIEATIKATYLKECKTIVEVKQLAMDNDMYKRALRTAAEEVEKKPKAYTQFQMMPLYTRYLIDYEPEANSPGIVLKSKAAFKEKLEEVVKAGRIRLVSVAGMLEGEEIVGQTSGAKGILLTIEKTSAGKPALVLTAADPPFASQETVQGQASKTTAAATMSPARNCWGHTYTETTANEDRYDHAVDVMANGRTVTISFPKSGIRRRATTAITDDARRALATWLTGAGIGHDEAQPLAIALKHKGKDSDNHRERIANLKTAIKGMLLAGQGMLDRQACWDNFKTKVWNPYYDEASYRKMFQKNFAVSWLIQAVVEAYVRLKHPDDKGVFLLHIPGRTNVGSLEELAPGFQDLRVSGAFYGDAFPAERDKTATYVATLPLDTPNLFKEKSKSIESIFAHEAGHAIFLPHAPRMDPKAVDPSQHKDGCHVKGDNCLMNYDVDSEHFCGLCMIRMRGWNWTPLPNSLGEQEYQVTFALDDVDTVFSAPATSREGLKERLQVLGMMNRPFDHPEAEACYDFCWNHFKEVFPELEGASSKFVRAFFKERIQEFLVEDGHLPAVGQYGKLRAPGGFYAGFSQNYLEASVPAADQGKAAAKPYEDFMLGADRGKLETAFYAANPALGKIPLKATVRRRPKGSADPWGECPMAPGARVYFELVPPDPVSGAPDGTGEFVTVAGGKCYHTSVKPPALQGAPNAYLQAKAGGYKPSAGPDAGNVHKELGGKRGGTVFRKTREEGFEEIPFDGTFKFASVVTADEEGVARIVFAPSRVGGDAYKLRVFVGPVTQEKTAAGLAKGGDDVVETGTMVRWRTIRVCHDIVMSPAADASEVPDEAGKKADGGSMPNVGSYFGDLPELDLAGAITVEMAKSYCELLIEPMAEAPVAVSCYGDDIKATAIQLAKKYPKFNTTAHAKVSIHKEAMAAVGGSGETVFKVTLATPPEPKTVSVRPRGGNLESAITKDADGAHGVTGAGAEIVTSASLDYDTGEVSVTFEAAQTGQSYEVCYHPAKYADIENLLFFPDTSPFLLNLRLPRAYNALIGAGYKPADANPLDETARPAAFHAFLDAQTLGLVKALLLDSVVRGVNRNGGFYPGLLFFRAHRVDNYTAIWPTGTQEGKGVGNGIFLFDTVGSGDAARFNALTLHEMSHGLFLMHAPAAPGNKADQHDAADRYCVMSYDANDGDHCGQCVAALRGMNTRNAPFR